MLRQRSSGYGLKPEIQTKSQDEATRKDQVEEGLMNREGGRDSRMDLEVLEGEFLEYESDETDYVYDSNQLPSF